MKTKPKKPAKPKAVEPIVKRPKYAFGEPIYYFYERDLPRVVEEFEKVILNAFCPEGSDAQEQEQVLNVVRAQLRAIGIDVV